ncbi:L-threonylcarbamoyladenylate synthase [Hyperthermus butylicus]|uniref:L-threonylcarbamoyladenylate synthase n=1 Tax=Hyperthermus butylicus (strain DSM 5456 / JCM 9403 / PLM1-5) TaxID=415426 RepID=A2BKW2_HYPBU|nr:L-threonylcarbamoyladenylate synthase [Hyperthermus butylicus]ABM80623.1 universally conserved protein [Hyperthermus butylicus DSM 5456]
MSSWCTPRAAAATMAAIRVAARIVALGGLVVYPTDTVYGLGANPFSSYAVWRVFRAKERPSNRPIPVLVSSLRAAEKIAELDDRARRLAERFWPGPLTIVVPAKPGLPSLLHAGTGRIGVRVPNHPIALKFIEAVGGAITGTSANLHRKPSPCTVQEAMKQLGCRVDIYLDGGPTPGGTPSTVVDLTTPKPRLVRRGPIPPEEIEAVLATPIEA